MKKEEEKKKKLGDDFSLEQRWSPTLRYVVESILSRSKALPKKYRVSSMARSCATKSISLDHTKKGRKRLNRLQDKNISKPGLILVINHSRSDDGIVCVKLRILGQPVQCFQDLLVFLDNHLPVNSCTLLNGE